MLVRCLGYGQRISERAAAGAFVVLLLASAAVLVF
jgi:hypothetical protein